MGDLTCSGAWEVGGGSCDLFSSPNAHVHPGLPKCPSQDIVVGCVAMADGSLLESFVAQLTCLEEGKKYTVSFYQSNCGWNPSYLGNISLELYHF